MEINNPPIDNTQDETSLRRRRKRAPSARQYRHELKYFIHEAQLSLLSQRLGMTMDLDPNANENGVYHIRSLYFDDVFQTAAVQKIAGDNNRKKYRIRIYNYKDNNIKLECKEKIESFIYKRTLQIDRDTCEKILRGDSKAILKYDNPLANEFFLRADSSLLRPVVIVDYLREAYISSYQSVRITLDQQLRSANFNGELFSRRIPVFPVLDDGLSILEVKFNQFLPEYYRYIIQGNAAIRSAASKYLICRKFE